MKNGYYVNETNPSRWKLRWDAIEYMIRNDKLFSILAQAEIVAY
jgi:hypothetical protein